MAKRGKASTGRGNSRGTSAKARPDKSRRDRGASAGTQAAKARPTSSSRRAAAAEAAEAIPSLHVPTGKPVPPLTTQAHPADPASVAEARPAEPPPVIAVPAGDASDTEPPEVLVPDVTDVPRAFHRRPVREPEPAPLHVEESPAHAEPPPAPEAPAEPSADPMRENPLLFEVGWEVCWQLGGIYTVLKSKVQAMQQRWGDRYCLIGPWNPATAEVEFDETEVEEPYRAAVQDLRNTGMQVHFGRWLVPGRPKVILLDYRHRYPSLDTDKYLLWKDHGIHTYSADGETNEVVAFGFAVTEFLRLMTEHHKGRPIIGHFHEWMAGVAVPRIAHLRIPVSTVFTTHATLLGRYIAGENPYFYDHLPFLNPEAEANKYNILPRFHIERAAAHASTVFTTISEVTATEAEHLLGRTVDRLLPNGLNIRKFAAPHEFQALHSQSKQRIHAFVMGHFFPSYTFDLDRTIYLLTSGRYEYRNKGMDLYIEALYRLNERLKATANPPTVVAFIVSRAATRQINVNVIQNHAMLEDLRSVCTDMQVDIGRRLFNAAVRGKVARFEDLVDDDDLVRLRQSMHAFRTSRQPMIVTHDLHDDANDPVLRHLRHRNLLNAQSDPVKVVFHPEFITHTSPLFHMNYDDFVRGCHMGVFPSYYEPWGYTPMETIALGLPAVTTNLAGFGAYVNRNVPENDSAGIKVLNRRFASFEMAVDELVEHLATFCTYNRRQRIECRNKVERTSQMFDWSNLVGRYHDAHDLALERWAAAKTAGKFELRLV